MQYVCFLVLYQTFSCIGSSGSRYDMLKNDYDFKMSEISNIACRWVKTNSARNFVEDLGLYMLKATLFSVFVSCKKQMKSHEVDGNIIQLDVAQLITQNIYGKRNLGP